MKLELYSGNEEKFYRRAIQLGATESVAKNTADLLSNPFSGWHDSIGWYMDEANNTSVRNWLNIKDEQ